MKPFSFSMLAVSALIFLSACGGGGSGGPGNMPPMVSEPDPPVSLPEPAVTLSQWNKLVPAVDTVASYLHDQIGELLLHREQPTVRIVADATPRFKSTVRHVLDGINAWLPYEQHLVLGVNVRDLPHIIDEIPTGEIWIGTSTFPDTEHVVLGRSFTTVDNRASVAVNAELSPDWSVEQLYALLLHEILHTVGMNHVNPTTHPGTVMASHGLPALAVYSMPEIDGVGLMAAYTRLPSGTVLTKDISPDRLGPWASEAAVLQGTLSACDCTFGADWINGVAVPWIDGTVTTGTFADSGLLGTVTWNGRVVGWTPDQAAVFGDTALAVNLGTLTGTADFTNLAFHDDQAQWGDGDLGYGVSLSGNYFRSTLGDDPGYVSGKFVGEQHDGALGILEHPDLTGAFGASRQ